MVVPGCVGIGVMVAVPVEARDAVVEVAFAGVGRFAYTTVPSSLVE